MTTITPPTLQADAYTCPHCGAFAKQEKLEIWRWIGSETFREPIRPFTVAVCQHCRKVGIWEHTKLIFPAASSAPPAHADMPSDIAVDYEEAREISAFSPRSAAALLRLCIQKLCIALGEPGENMNTDIGRLVTKGLSPLTQKAFDIVRIIGNEQVHPGTLDVRDNPEIANRLFILVNFIVEDQISKPREIAALYEQLPAAKLKGIVDRDKTKQ